MSSFNNAIQQLSPYLLGGTLLSVLVYFLFKKETNQKKFNEKISNSKPSQPEPKQTPEEKAQFQLAQLEEKIRPIITQINNIFPNQCEDFLKDFSKGSEGTLKEKHFKKLKDFHGKLTESLTRFMIQLDAIDCMSFTEIRANRKILLKQIHEANKLADIWLEKVKGI